MSLRTIPEPGHLETTETGGVSATQQVDLLDLLAIFTKRRKFIVRFVATVVCLTAIIVFLIPDQYTATTVILPPQQNASAGSAILSQLGGNGALASLAGGSLGLKNPGDMYVAMFHSRSVEDALIQRFGLISRYHAKAMYGAREDLESHTTVTLGTKDGLITITATDRDPKFAAQLANGYVQEFSKHSNGLALTESSQRRAFFQQQLLQADGNLVQAEEGLKHTQQTTGILQLDSQARALIETSASLRGQITAKEVQLQGMHSFATANNPEYVLAQEQLNALKAQLAKVAGAGGSVGSGVGVSKEGVSQAGITYLNSMRDVRYYETIVELLSKQFELAKLDEARQGTIQISDLAVPPERHSSPKRILIVILAVIGASIVALLCALAMEMIHNLPAEKQEKLDMILGRKRSSTPAASGSIG